MAWVQDRLGPLRQANFRRFFTGYATSLLGTAMAPVGVAFAVLDAGGSASDLGFVLTAGVLATNVCLVTGGVVADRYGRRKVMLASDVVCCAAQAAFAGLVLAGHPPLWALVGLSALVGAGFGFFGPALTALPAEIVDSDDLHDVNALVGVAKNVGRTCGPALAGALVAATSAGVVVAVDAATYAVSAISLALLDMPGAGARHGGSMLGDLRQGWAAWRRRPWIWLTDIHLALFNAIVYAPLLVLGPAIAKHHLGGAAPWGVIVTALGLGAVIAGVALIGRRPKRPLQTAIIAQAAWALPLAALALLLPAPAIAAAALAAGIGTATFVTLWVATLQRNVPAALLARVSSYDYLAAYALGPIGLATVGPIASHVGDTTVLWASATWQVISVAALVLLPPVRRFRDAASRRDEGEGKPATPSHRTGPPSAKPTAQIPTPPAHRTGSDASEDT